MIISYPAKIVLDEDQRYLITFPDLDEAITEGETLDEALFNASEVLTLTLEGRVDEKIPIPQASKLKGKNMYQIFPSARVQSALLLRKAQASRTKASIAHALNTSWASIDRLEDLHHWPSLKMLERAAAVMGQQVVISFEPKSLVDKKLT